VIGGCNETTIPPLIERFTMLVQVGKASRRGVFTQQKKLPVAGQLPGRENAGVISMEAGAAAHGIL